MVWDERDTCRKKCDRTEATAVAKDTRGRLVDGGCGNNREELMNVNSTGWEKPKYEDDKLIFLDKEEERRKRDRNRNRNRKKNKARNKSRKKNRGK